MDTPPASQPLLPLVCGSSSRPSNNLRLERNSEEDLQGVVLTAHSRSMPIQDPKSPVLEANATVAKASYSKYTARILALSGIPFQ